MILQSLLVFVFVGGADVCWVRYIAHATAGGRLGASAWAVLLYLAGAISILSYTENHYLILPAALGAFVGTFLGVKRP